MAEDEIDGIKAFTPDLPNVIWSPNSSQTILKNMVERLIRKDWLQIYNTTIQSMGGDSFVIANYLPVCMYAASRTSLTNLPVILGASFVANLLVIFKQRLKGRVVFGNLAEFINERMSI